jgi:hypothetical protein
MAKLHFHTIPDAKPLYSFAGIAHVIKGCQAGGAKFRPYRWVAIRFASRAEKRGHRIS